MNKCLFFKLAIALVILFNIIPSSAQDSIYYKNEIINRLDVLKQKQGTWKLYDEDYGHYMEINYKDDSLIGPILFKKKDSLLLKISEPVKKPSEFVLFYKGQIIPAYKSYKNEEVILRSSRDSLPLSKEISEEASKYFQVKPMFYGGQNALLKFIRDTTKPPKIKGLVERIVVDFIIDKNGYIIEAKISKSASEAANKEALRVMSLMPRWQPGYQRGKAVKVKQRIPFVFQ